MLVVRNNSHAHDALKTVKQKLRGLPVQSSQTPATAGAPKAVELSHI
jgi:hypothetical protein